MSLPRAEHFRYQWQVKKKLLIGWSELVDFPEWKIPGIKAKVDTGALNSALHVENFKKLKSGRVSFDVIHGTKLHPRFKHVVATPKRWGRVRSSNGIYQHRCFVDARVHIGPITKIIELSLVSRDKMEFRMLLGRTALHDFQIDPSRRMLLSPKHQPAPSRHS